MLFLILSVTHPYTATGEGPLACLNVLRVVLSPFDLVVVLAEYWATSKYLERAVPYSLGDTCVHYYRRTILVITKTQDIACIPSMTCRTDAVEPSGRRLT